MSPNSQSTICRAQQVTWKPCRPPQARRRQGLGDHQQGNNRPSARALSATSAAHDLRLAKVSRKNENCIQNIRFAHKWEIERLLEEVRVQQDADNHQYEADLGEGRAAIEKWKLQTEAAKEELRRTQEGTFDKT